MKQSGHIQKGAKVRLIDEDFEGKVVKVKETTLIFVCSDGFEHEYPINKVVVANKQPWFDEAISDIDTEVEVSASMENQQADRNKKSPVIDLHLHELIAIESGLTSHDKLQIQLREFKNQLALARKRKVRKIIFIHGVGSGRLRQELEQQLQSEKCDFHDASYAEFGGGAIEVLLY